MYAYCWVDDQSSCLLNEFRLWLRRFFCCSFFFLLFACCICYQVNAGNLFFHGMVLISFDYFGSIIWSFLNSQDTDGCMTTIDEHVNYCQLLSIVKVRNLYILDIKPLMSVYIASDVADDRSQFKTLQKTLYKQYKKLFPSLTLVVGTQVKVCRTFHKCFFPEQIKDPAKSDQQRLQFHFPHQTSTHAD